MKTLISTDSQLYSKRIVREINSIKRSGKSVYVTVGNFLMSAPTNVRVMKAGTCLQSSDIVATDYSGFTYKVKPTMFIDESGNEVCATRQ